MANTTGRPAGRPRKYTSNAKQTEYKDLPVLEDKIEDYFASCKDLNKKPNKQGLAVFLGVNTDTLNEWSNNKDNIYDGFSVAIKRACDIMSDMLQQRVDPMAMISVKQPCYGGFIDRPVQDNSNSTVDIVVKLDGLDKH